MIKISAGKNDGGQRIDRFLRKYLTNASLSVIYKMLRKDIKVNGRRVRQNAMLEEGDEITLYISDDEFARYTKRAARKKAPKRTFRVIYEDENVLIVNKPAGLLVHGDSHEKKNTLVNQVTDYLIASGSYRPGREKTFSPAAANRLDRNTSGMVIFGKNADSLRALTAMIRDRGCVEKHYLTVVSGEFREHAVLRGRAVKDERHNRVNVSGSSGHAEGKEVVTEVTPVACAGGMSLLDINLITGRTHQIRAHLASEGYPVAGDVKYGDAAVNKKLREKYGLRSQFLHAYRLDIIRAYEPVEYLSGRRFDDPLPPGLRKTAEAVFGEDLDFVTDK